ncbi:hypothetical protein GN956_G14733 [Arapaima gigas]
MRRSVTPLSCLNPGRRSRGEPQNSKLRPAGSFGPRESRAAVGLDAPGGQLLGARVGGRDAQAAVSHAAGSKTPTSPGVERKQPGRLRWPCASRWGTG